MRRDPLIICAAITGGAPAASRTRFHPLTPSAVVASALGAWEAGASILHLHARTQDGDTTTDPAAYRSLVAELRSAGCDAVLSLSAGDDGGRASRDARVSVCDAGGDLVSLGSGSFNIGQRVYDNAPEYIGRMLQKLHGTMVRPEIEIFDTGHLAGMRTIIDGGLVPAPHFVELVFGVPGGMPIDRRLLNVIVERLPASVRWIASVQTNDASSHEQMLRAAVDLQGHIRVGMEDNAFIADGRAAQSNAELVANWVSWARQSGHRVATAADARQLLGFPPLPKRA